MAGSPDARNDGPERPDLGLEEDPRFPSGPWTGFFQMPGSKARHKMEIHLTFRDGTLRGEGRDRVGRFLFRGRYEVDSGKCHWTKQYIGQHDIYYQGYNEGRGIWGVWEWPGDPRWSAGFHIWPEAMGDPTQQVDRAEAEADVGAEAPLVTAEPELEVAPAGPCP